LAFRGFLQPNQGYRREYLWLPRSYVKNDSGIKASLTFPLGDQSKLRAWEETNNHLIVPREYIPFEEYEDLPFPIEDRTPREFPSIGNIQLVYDLRDVPQRVGYKHLLESGNGVLSLACGKGKTVVALHAWAATGVPALVVVDSKNILYQWVDRIVEHTNVAREDIGVVGDGQDNWEHPITVALIQTLARRVSDFELPDEYGSHFGLAVYDEAHILGAPLFNTTASICHGLRWGLSATHERSDGLDILYKYHLGDVVYENLEQDVIPECFFVNTGIYASGATLQKCRVRGTINFARLCTWLAGNQRRNRLIQHYIDDALAEGRKILALSHIVDHLKYFYDQNPGSGLIIGEVKGTERSSELYDHDLVFATTKIAQKALDRKDLDTVFVLLPFKDKGLLQQVIGRIQRKLEGKNVPIVVIFEDERIRTTHQQCRELRTHLTEFRYPFSITRD